MNDIAELHGGERDGDRFLIRCDETGYPPFIVHMPRRQPVNWWEPDDRDVARFPPVYDVYERTVISDDSHCWIYRHKGTT
jgi:hypothetical protein